ncbi:MAG: MATE family efflux transporter [bacterium]|nr:MATE family efflux transporter [bacterium]MCM1374203.1 MATE family efflux transporter [Muribaculum sp.]
MHNKNIDLTEDSIIKGIIRFAIPLFLGQLLQQFYNMADAWVVGNFADNDAFAAVSSGGSLTFLIIGFFNGISIGGGVVISRYFGAKEEGNVQKAIHSNFLFGLLASALATTAGLLLVPGILRLMRTPDSVLPHSLSYFRICFAGVCTVILYNICMSIMRALGDSLHPLYYLIFSSLVNVALDLVFVAGFQWGVSGAAIATVIAQGLSVLLCLVRMCREPNENLRLDFRKLRFHRNMMSQIIQQGLPTGIQNSVISIGNIVIQSNINAFGAYAISGQGAYAKVEGFVFLPIMSMSMVLPTFVSQNLGAKKYDRAKKGAAFGVLSGVILAELVGVVLYVWAPYILRFFVDSDQAVEYGCIHAHTVAPFFFLLAFSHCAAGVMRGCGKAFIPMITMLLFWCGVRIIYVTLAVQRFPVFQTVSWAYPLTWSLSSVTFLIALFKLDWTHAFEKE